MQNFAYEMAEKIVSHESKVKEINSKDDNKVKEDENKVGSQESYKPERSQS